MSEGSIKISKSAPALHEQAVMSSSEKNSVGISMYFIGFLKMGKSLSLG